MLNWKIIGIEAKKISYLAVVFLTVETPIPPIIIEALKLEIAEKHIYTLQKISTLY